MATLNPLEKKARSSFIKGIVVAGLFGILGMVLLGVWVYKLRQAEAVRLGGQKSVIVLTQEMVSGEELTAGMFRKIKVDAQMVPKGAASSINDLTGYFWQDENGNDITTEPVYENANSDEPEYKKVIRILSESGNENVYEIQGSGLDTNDYTGNYYYYRTAPLKEIDGKLIETNYSEFENLNDIAKEQVITRIKVAEPVLVAKIDIPANTPVTDSMFTRSEDIISNDLREQELNMIVLPSGLVDNDTIDIRLRLPNGTDYIVASKKKVVIPDVGDGKSESTIRIKANEQEILAIDSAIIDAYKIDGSKLYAIKYTDPGLQNQAIVTYVPSEATLNLIRADSNIVTVAKEALYTKYAQLYNAGDRQQINNALSSISTDTQNANQKTNTDKEIAVQQTERKSYLDSME